MTGPVLIALAAALFWGMADFGGGLAARRIPVATVLLATQLVGLLISGAIVVATAPQVPSTEAVLASLGAGVAGTTGLGCFYRALARGSMSIVAPIASTGVALPVLIGLLSGDALHFAQGIGLAVAVAGVVLASRPADHAPAPQAQRSAILLSLVAALGFGLYFTGAHIGAVGGAAWMLMLSHAIALAGVALLVALQPGTPISPPRELRPGLLLIALLDISATGLYALANRHGLLSVVAVVGSLYPVTTVALARLVLHERVGRTQAAGVIFALGGVMLIAGG